MIFEFVCDICGFSKDIDSKPFQPPETPFCDGPTLFSNPHKKAKMRRIYGAQIDTSGCRDHDYIPPQARVANDVQGVSRERGERTVRKYQRGIAERRKALADGNTGSIRQTHAVPAHLYHGKIKQTGDLNYWKDQKNIDRHKSCKVDNYGR